MAQWLLKDPSRNNRRTPPETTYLSIALQRVTGSADILFLDAENVLVSVGVVVYRWNLLNDKLPKRPVKGTLVWRYRPPSPATSMARLGANMVVIGTNRGHLCLLDWTRRTKERSFSREHSPKVLQNWSKK